MKKKFADNLAAYKAEQEAIKAGAHFLVQFTDAYIDLLREQAFRTYEEAEAVIRHCERFNPFGCAFWTTVYEISADGEKKIVY